MVDAAKKQESGLPIECAASAERDAYALNCMLLRMAGAQVCLPFFFTLSVPLPITPSLSALPVLPAVLPSLLCLLGLGEKLSDSSPP